MLTSLIRSILPNTSTTPKQSSEAKTDERAATSTTTNETNIMVVTPPPPVLKEPAAGADSTETTSIPELWSCVDRELRINVGTSWKCSICLSTFSSCKTLRTPCGHLFCHECLSHSFAASNNTCPECNQGPITKRNCHDSAALVGPIAKAYKGLLQSFGLTPITYDPSFSTLTQAASSSVSSASKTDDDDELQDYWNAYQVAHTWQQTAASGMTPLQRDENAKVVTSNRTAFADRRDEAAHETDWFPAEDLAGETVVSSLAEAAADSTKVADEEPLSMTLFHKNDKGGGIPTTQEVQEEAREQQWADHLEFEEVEEDENRHGTSCPSVFSAISALTTKSGSSMKSKGSTGASNNRRVSFGSPSTTPTATRSKEEESKRLLLDLIPFCASQSPIDMLGSQQLPEQAAIAPHSTTPSTTMNVTGMVEDSFGALHWASSDYHHDGDGNDHEAPASQEDQKPAAMSRPSPLMPQQQETKASTDESKGYDSDDDLKSFSTTATAATTASSCSATSRDDDDDDPSLYFQVGDIVAVQARTWPGINKPGGVARITKRIEADESSSGGETRYHVSYVLGGSEKNVDHLFVQKVQQEENEDDDTRSVSSSRSRRSSSSQQSSQQRHQGQTFSDNNDMVVTTFRKRRRREAELPTLLLRQLAAQGFDTRVAVPVGTESNRPRVVSFADRPTNPARERKRKSRSSIKERASKQPQKESKTSDSRKAGRSAIDGKENQHVKKKRASSSSTTTTKSMKKPSAKAKAPNQTSNASEKPPSKPKAKRKSPSDSTSDWPVLSDDQVTSLSLEHYASEFTKAVESETLDIVASHLNEADKTALKALSDKTLAGNLRLKVSSSFNKRTALCIMPVDQNSHSNSRCTRLRTAKAMRSALAGVPIVSPQWIHESASQTKAIVPSLDMIATSIPVKRPELENDSRLGIARLAAYRRKSPTCKGLLQGCTVFACDIESEALLADVHILSKQAGAKVVTSHDAIKASLSSLNSSSSTSAEVILVVPPGKAGGTIPPKIYQEALRVLKNDSKSVSIVSAVWLFDSIACAKRLPVDSYEPQQQQAKELWHLTCRKTII